MVCAPSFDWAGSALDRLFFNLKGVEEDEGGGGLAAFCLESFQFLAR